MYGSAVGMIEKSNIYGYIMSGVEVHDAGTAPMRVCACLGGCVDVWVISSCSFIYL